MYLLLSKQRNDTELNWNALSTEPRELMENKGI